MPESFLGGCSVGGARSFRSWRTLPRTLADRSEVPRRSVDTRQNARVCGAKVESCILTDIFSQKSIFHPIFGRIGEILAWRLAAASLHPVGRRPVQHIYSCGKIKHAQLAPHGRVAGIGETKAGSPTPSDFKQCERDRASQLQHARTVRPSGSTISIAADMALGIAAEATACGPGGTAAAMPSRRGIPISSPCGTTRSSTAGHTDAASRQPPRVR